jgi:2-dehydro-3-deoxyglucarate aldolase
MNKLESIARLRNKLLSGSFSIGSWIQIPHASVAEVMGQSGYDWVAVDLEHGSISTHQLPDLFRALELGGTLPLARLAEGTSKDCKQALDAGAAGVIVPMIESSEHLLRIRDACCWPPAGNRGVGFSRANLFGRNFDSYSSEAQAPILVAMIEHHRALKDLDKILKVGGLDAILIGPYDFSASMGLTSMFEHPDFITSIAKIQALCHENSIPCGIHIVDPSPRDLRSRIDEGYRFIAYSIDSVFLNKSCVNPTDKLL